MLWFEEFKHGLSLSFGFLYFLKLKIKDVDFGDLIVCLGFFNDVPELLNGLCGVLS